MTRAAGVGFLLLVGCTRAEPLSVGEFTSIAPEAVRTVDYETPEFRFSAHRFTPQERFQVTIQRPGAPIRTCLIDADARVLSELEALQIKGRIAEAELGKGPFHRLRYTAEPPMQAYEELLTLLPSGNLGLMSDGYAYVLTLTKQLVEGLANACK